MKKFQINIFCSILTLSLFGATLARPKEFRELIGIGSIFFPNKSKIMSARGEPTCQQLRVMWRFSRRQSRAAEITNEIPTYKDPFAYNDWENHPKVRSSLGNRRSSAKPSDVIYGRVVKHAPNDQQKKLPPDTKILDEMLRLMENEKPREKPQISTHRLSKSQAQGNKLSSTGSFQRLKEMIWADRVKELHQRRLLEETAAKLAEKIAQEYDDYNKGQSVNYKYIDQEAKGARLRLLNKDTDMDAAYVPDVYIRPYPQRLAFNSESSNERLW